MALADEPTLRAAVEGDHAAVVALMGELGIDDPPPDADTFVRDLLAGTRVLVDGAGAVVGYVWFLLLADRVRVNNLVVHPARRGQRLGERLLHAAASEGRAAGLAAWELNVKPDNASALALYRRMGLREVLASTSFAFSDDVVARLPVDPSLAVVELGEPEATELETRFALGAGRFAVSRARQGRLALGVARAGRLVGGAVLDPTFPGLAPLATDEAGVVRALIDASRPLVRVARPIRGFVEGQPALAAALRGAGARPVLEVVRLAGAL